MVELPICPNCRNDKLIWLEKKCENEIKDLIKGMKGMKYKVNNNRVEYLENNKWIESNYFIQPDDIIACGNCEYYSQYLDFLKNDNKDTNDIIKITFRTVEEYDFDVRCHKNEYFFVAENLFYQQNQEFRNTNNQYFKNKTEILRFKTIQENNINDGDIIILERSNKIKKTE